MDTTSMLTQAQVLDAVKAGRRSGCLDGRDYSRLVEFFPHSEWTHFGFKLAAGADPPEPKPWSREAVLAQLADDLAFGFEKALNKRGISAGLMYEVVKTWMWVLGDELASFDDYAQYGLPLFKAVAVKYGMDNPIGEDAGDEPSYACD